MPDSVSSNHFNIQKALEYIDTGEWRVPLFQRPFVWTNKDIKLLLDSIFHDYPCGVLLLMPFDAKIAGRPFEGSSPDTDPKKLVLDGQQRLTSCYNVFYNHGKEYKGGKKRYYYLDLNALYRKCKEIGLENGKYDRSKINLVDEKIITDELQKEPPTNIVDGRIPFFMLKDDAQFSEYMKSYLKIAHLPEDMMDFLDIHLRTLIKPFSDYNFQALIVSEDMGLSAVCRIFETLNNTGVKLDSFDICVAKYMADRSDLDIKKRLDESLKGHPCLRPLFLKNLEKDDDYRNREFVLQTIALYLGCDHRKNALAENLKGEDVARLWDDAIDNLDHAVAILDKYARTKSTMDIIPYSVTIPVAAAALMKCGYDGMSVKKKGTADRIIVKYLFCTAFDQHYGDGTPGKMGKDYSALCRWISENSEPDQCFKTRIDLNLETLEGIGKKNKSAVSQAIRCIYISRNPEDFIRDKTVDLETANLHHLFPLKRYGDVDSILNLAYLEGSSNSSIGDKSVEVYTDGIIEDLGEERFQEILKDHFISGKTYECYRNGDYRGFVQRRFDEIVKYMRTTMGLDVQVVSRVDETDDEDERWRFHVSDAPVRTIIYCQHIQSMPGMKSDS